jgi:hypothetical protein
MSTAARGVAPSQPCSHHRDWGGRGQVSPPASCQPWPPLLVQSFVLMSPVFTCPLDSKMAAGGGEAMGEFLGGSKHFGGISGQVLRGLPGFTWPLIPSNTALS